MDASILVYATSVLKNVKLVQDQSVSSQSLDERCQSSYRAPGWRRAIVTQPARWIGTFVYSITSFLNKTFPPVYDGDIEQADPLGI